MSAASSRVAVVDRLCDFFVAATQTILYAREVYPRDTFEARERYGVPVYVSRSPLLYDYVRDTVGSFRDWLLQDSVNSVVVALHNAGTGVVVSRYVFDVALLVDGGEVSAVSLGALEAQFRAHLLRLSTVAVDGDDGLGQGGKDVGRTGRTELGFGFVLHTKGVQPGQAWIAASEREARAFERATGVGAVPLKDADPQSDTAFVASRIETPFALV